MKSKFSRILGVGLVLTVLASLLVVATPASAGYMGWTLDSAPVVKSNVDIYDMAVASNGTTGYAVSSENNTVYKTTNGGTIWAPTGFAGGYACHVAVAPDVADGSFVAVTADGTEVWVSTNGGTTFTQMAGITGVAALNSIAVSPAVGTARSVAVAGTDNDSAAVWYFTSSPDFGGTAGWVDALSDATWGAANVTGLNDALAVKYSPNYLQDRTLIAVTVSTSTNSTYLNLANVATMKWNADYAVYGATSGGQVISAAVATTAAIDVPASYMAFDATLRVTYVALNPGGLFRGTLLSTVGVGMQSVAVNAAGDKLVAGAYASNTVYRMASPAVPTSILSASTKSPSWTTASKTTVEFFGTSVGAATVGGAAADESAFALSADDGKSFNDVAFIDTVATATDFAVNADGSKYYLVTENAGVVSLWRKTTAWERVYKVAGTGYIVRPAMDNFDAIFFVDAGTANIWYSNDAGQASWQPRVAYGLITDFAAESVSVLYVLTGASVSKATDGGFLWDNPIKVTGAGTGTSMTLLAKDNLLVAGATGVAYTTDGGAIWTSLGLGFANAVEAVADKLAAGGTITAVDATSVKTFTVGTSVAFSPAAATVTAPYAINGIVINGGVTYVVSNNTSDGSMLRSPITSIPTWGTIPAALTVLKDVKGATGGKLYSVAANSIYIYTEIFAAAGPAAAGPADKFLVPMNMETGGANNVVFQWTPIANSPLGTTYNLQISLDSAFTQVVFGGPGYTAIGGPMAIVGPTGTYAFSFQADTTYYWRVRVNYLVDSPWSATPRSFKIETLAPLKLISPANGTNGVSVKPTFAWSVAAGATTYELVVSDDPTFAIITFSRTSDKAVFAADEQLAYGTVYYWRVRASAPATAITPFVVGVFTTEPKPTTTAPPFTITQPAQSTITVEVPPTVEAIPAYLLWIIIGIGAILVIALIVLIVRTRRVS